ncbi:MAG: PRC-barrel domain-containing protein [Anaerolineales bacterium]|jgi:sporulation protein YlmC with PRC-barrel domain
MEIPVQAQVECKDGLCGRSIYVLINPVTDQVTHLVVKEDGSDTEYIVPVEYVTETIASTIRLRCTKTNLKKMHRFIKTTFIEEKVPYTSLGGGNEMYGRGAYYYLPYVDPEMTVQVPVEHKQIPPGELAVERGTRVEATDGYVGHVDEFVVNPKNGHITHLVMREGHLWGQKDVIIPVSAMGDTLGKTVFLKLDKHQIESLPAFPLHRRWS